MEETGSRGTDEVFYKIVRIAPAAILKLVGVTHGHHYQFHSETLKSKKVSPDVIAKPGEETGDVVFMEFQGYPDKYIRYRLSTAMTMYCTQNDYQRGVLPVIFFTDRVYHEVALPLDRNDSTGNFGFKGNFKEIILEDLTEAELLRIDPQLVILAPVTIPQGTSKEELTRKSQHWREQVQKNYPDKDTTQVLDSMALLLLNKFRGINREEIVQMLNFDLADTQAGQDLIQMGEKKGEIKGEKKGEIKTSRDLLLDALEARFGVVSETIVDQINQIDNLRILKYLHREAIQTDGMETFKTKLAEALSQL
jgi:predicted transposase YdaD